MLLAQLVFWYNKRGSHRPPSPDVLTLEGGRVVIEGSMFTCAKAVHPVSKEACLVFTEHPGHNGIPGKAKSYRFTMQALKNIKFECEGEEL